MDRARGMREKAIAIARVKNTVKVKLWGGSRWGVLTQKSRAG